MRFEANERFLRLHAIRRSHHIWETMGFLWAYMFVTGINDHVSLLEIRVQAIDHRIANRAVR